VVLVHYGELALKSPGIRSWYEKILIKTFWQCWIQEELPFSNSSGMGQDIHWDPRFSCCRSIS
jgi:adenylyl- and sulfurtransferase ThiI